MAADTVHGGVGEVLAVLAEQFSQLAMSLADSADQPLAQQRLVQCAVFRAPNTPR